MRKLIVLVILIFMVIAAAGCGTKQSNTEISSDVDFGKDDYQKIVFANNQLGMEMLKEVKADDKGNVFISPTSLFFALSMVYNGAGGETKAEMAKSMQIDGMNTDELNRANASLMKQLHSRAKDIELNVANSIWLNERFHFQSDFAQKNQNYFNAELQEINVSDDSSPQIMNDWVKKATKKKITEIVESPLDPRLVAILINAIYFKGDWTYAFDEKATEQRAFYVNGNEKKQHPLMKLDERLPYFENDRFQAISLPYGKDESMSMKVFLPKEDSSLTEFEKLLNDENWQNWLSEFQEKEGTLMLPKFKLEYEAVLNETLQALGMTSGFKEQEADFSNMIEEDAPVWISKVKQKTYMDINEKGTEAAAVTSIEMETTSAPVEERFSMEVNRPFFLAITDDESGAILFMGLITNPSQGK